MRWVLPVAMLLLMLTFTACGGSDESPTVPAGETERSPTPEDTVATASPTVTSATLEATATLPVSASPQQADTSRYFLRASAEIGQSSDAEHVQLASDIVKARLETFLGIPVRISPDPQFPDVIVVDVATAQFTDAELSIVERLMSEVGLMELIDTQGNTLEPGSVVSTTLGASDAGGPTYETIVSSEDVARAYVTTDQFGIEVVGFELDPEGTARFEAHTSANIGQPMSIVIDKRVINTAPILSAISSQAIINGLTGDEAAKIAIQLESGPLPVTLVLIDDPAG